MKIYYGYHDEDNLEMNISNEKDIIKGKINDLRQIYDWATVVDNNGNDVTIEYM